MANNLLFLTICIIPSICLLLYIYANDKIEKEPLYLLLILFIEGLISCLIAVYISNILKLYNPYLSYVNTHKIAFKTLILISVVEECLKWIVNYFTIWKNKNFDHLYDPIIYSATVALGFATCENILYGTVFYNINSYTMIIRGIISVPCHAAFGIFMGYYLAMAKKYTRNKSFTTGYKILSIFYPIALHFAYNTLLIKQTIYSNTVFIIYVIFVCTSAFIMIKNFSKQKYKIN